MVFSGIGANLFFILTVSLLSWYQWSDSVWMEEARKRIRNRAEESRRKRSQGISEVSTTDEKSFDDDDEEEEVEEEDISILEEKPIRSLDDDSDIEELSGLSEIREVRQRKTTAKSAGTAST